MSTETHRLIAIATSENPGIPAANVARLAGVRDRIVELFTQTLRCYGVELPQIGVNPTAQALRDGLDDWFASDERMPSDWLVFYYTGHAELVPPDSLYLLTTDYVPDRPVKSSFDTRQLVNVVLARRSPVAPRRTQNILFIFDTCYAGQTVPNFTADLAEAFRTLTRGNFYVVGTARKEANAGAFSEALIAEVDELSRRFVAQEYLFLDQILAGVNRRLRVHQAMLCIASVPQDVPKFFPNPGYVGSGPFLADEAQRALGDHEYREAWIRRSSGVAFESQVGGYFSGRRAVLDVLERFLRNRIENRVCVVTGNAGGGKSAILGRIVALASIRDFPPLDLIVYARGKTLHDVLNDAAATLTIAPTIESVLRYVRGITGTFRVMVDALDEAVEPEVIVRQLLLELGALPAVRLIVATRRQYVRRFTQAMVIDIDDPAYAHESDIADFVLARLLRRKEDHVATPFSDDALTAMVAQRIAARAYPNFLVARLTAEVLLRAALDDLAERTDFPASIAEAFALYLRDFGDDERRARDVLLPLAFAQSPGLPWDTLWPTVATAIAGRPYTDTDVQWLLANAGAFIFESSHDGRSVYRLYHESLAEYLRAGHVLADVARAFVDALVASVVRRTDCDAPDWALAPPYVLENLVLHCMQSGSLANVADPYFLLCARPRPLLRSLLESHDLPVALAAPYADISRDPSGSLPERAAYFEMSARMRGYAGVADDVARLPLSRTWRALWARWSPTAARPLLFAGLQPISRIAASTWFDDHAYIVLGRVDGSLEVWDADDFACVFAETTVRPGQRVVAVHLAPTANGGWLVAAWADGTLAAFDLRAGTIVKSRAFATVTRAIAVVDRGDVGVCLVADGNGGLTLLQLPDLATLVAKPNALHNAVTAMTTVAVGGEPVLVTASDGHGKDGRSWPALNAWSLRDLARVWHAPRSSDYVETLMVVTFNGRQLLLAAGSPVRATEIWDVAMRRVVFSRDGSRKETWLHVDGPKLLLVGRRYDGTFVEELEMDSAGDLRIVGSATSIVQLEGDTFAGPVRLGGRSFLAESAGAGVRLWALEQLATTTAFNRAVGKPVYATTSLVVRGSTVFTGGATVRAVSVADGYELGRWPASEYERLRDGGDNVFHVTATPDRVFVCTRGGFVIEIDPADLGRRRTVSTSAYEFYGLCAVEAGGHIFGFAVTNDITGYRRRWCVTIWDLDAGRMIETDVVLGHRFGAEDKMLTALTAIAIGAGVRFALASTYGAVLVATFDVASASVSTTFGIVDEWPLLNEQGYIYSLASAQCADRTLLAGGSDSGRITLWDFLTGTMLETRAGAHDRAVSALRFGRLAERDIVVSGGWDGCVVFAGLNLRPLLRVTVGAPIACIDFLDDRTVAIGTLQGVLSIAVDPTNLDFDVIDGERDLAPISPSPNTF